MNKAKSRQSSHTSPSQQRYVSEGRREKNKKRKIKKHENAMEKLHLNAVKKKRGKYKIKERIK